MTTAVSTQGAGLLPARPLAAQAHALRATAAFIERTGLAGLSVTADAGGIIISVPRHTGTPAARATAVAFLAATIGGTRPARTEYRSWAWVSATGTIAGHDARVTTTIEPGEESA